MDQKFLQKAMDLSQAHKNFVCATIINSTLKGTPRKVGTKMLVFENGEIFGTIGGGRNEADVIKESLKIFKTREHRCLTYNYYGKEKGQSICGGQIKVFLEPFIPQNHLIICGAGHISLPLSYMSKMLNFNVTVIDNRKKFANKKRFEHVDFVKCGSYASLLNKISLTKNTYVVIVTQGNESDYICLENVITSTAAYVGVISSKAKRIKFLKKLKDSGIEKKYLKKIIMPLGIDIGAQTPEEIALSISSEIVQYINQKHLKTDKFTAK